MPGKSVDIAFGFLLDGGGRVSGADFKLRKVGREVPVTAHGSILPPKPQNLNFEQ